MKRVRLFTETGNLIHFRHPYRLGYVLFCLSIILALISMVFPPLTSQVEAWAMSGVLGIFGLGFWLYRQDVQFFPNQRSFLVRQGFWPFLKTHEGSYDELIGVVLTKTRGNWVASFVFTSLKTPIAYAVGKNEADVRFQFERFAKHLQSKAYDQTDPEKTIEFEWNQLGYEMDEFSQITQNLPDIDFDAPPKGLYLEHGRKGFRIELPSSKGFRFRFLLLMGLGLCFCALSLVSLFLLSEHTLSDVVGIVLTILMAGFAALIAGASGYFGRERIMLYQEKVHTDFAFLGMPFWTKSIPTDKIDEIIVRSQKRKPVEGKKASKKNKSDGQNEKPKNLELFIDAGFSQVNFGTNQDQETLEWIRSALIQKIYQSEEAA